MSVELALYTDLPSADKPRRHEVEARDYRRAPMSPWTPCPCGTLTELRSEAVFRSSSEWGWVRHMAVIWTSHLGYAFWAQPINGDRGEFITGNQTTTFNIDFTIGGLFTLVGERAHVHV